MNEVSIKETKEALAAIKLCVILTKKIVDGGVAAAPVAILEAASKTSVFIDGYKGVDLIKEELSNLSKEEMIELFVTIFDGVKDVEKA